MSGSEPSGSSALVPRRADARANRTRIVAAAREALSTSGELQLNAVARAAGVGQGTLYRHFPSREHLLVEVYSQEVDELVARGDALLQDAPPLEALASWFARLAAYARVKRGVLLAVEASVRADLLGGSEARIRDAIEGLLEAGRRTGEVRPEIDARDVVLLIGALGRLASDEWDERASRLCDAVLRGLRT